MAPAFQNWWGFLGLLMECDFNRLPDFSPPAKGRGRRILASKWEDRFEPDLVSNQPCAPGQDHSPVWYKTWGWDKGISEVFSSPNILYFQVSCVPDGCWDTAGRKIFKQNQSWGQGAFIKHFCIFLFWGVLWEGRRWRHKAAIRHSITTQRFSIRSRLAKEKMLTGKITMTLKQTNNCTPSYPGASSLSSSWVNFLTIKNWWFSWFTQLIKLGRSHFPLYFCLIRKHILVDWHPFL